MIDLTPGSEKCVDLGGSYNSLTLLVYISRAPKTVVIIWWPFFDIGILRFSLPDVECLLIN